MIPISNRQGWPIARGVSTTDFQDVADCLQKACINKRFFRGNCLNTLLIRYSIPAPE